MKFPNDFWEPIIAVTIFIIGSVIYHVSIRNRGSYTDTPDWSKVIRRVVELVCVIVSVLFISYMGWGKTWYVSTLMICFPALGFLAIPAIALLRKVFPESKLVPAAEKLNEHFANALILALFLLCGMLIFLISIAKGVDESGISVIYLYIMLDFLLSAEIAFLAYQLYYLIVEKNIPSDDIVQVIRICEELND